jgi:molybdate transport repressor ModE-like protein
MFGEKTGWSVGFRVWVKRSGHTVLGPGRVELLEEIDRLHSIRAAAAHLGMSYRRAWTMVRSMNNAAGEPLVMVATGGRGGGGANLTPFGRSAITRFQSLSKQLALVIAQLSSE